MLTAAKVLRYKILGYFSYRRFYKPCRCLSLGFSQNGEAKREISHNFTESLKLPMCLFKRD